MKSRITMVIVALALAGCGGGSSSSDTDAIQVLKDRIITGRSIISSNDWLCEFMDSDGAVQFTDTYRFLVDGLGTAEDGFFDWLAASGDTVSVTKQVVNDRYTISEISFATADFTDDSFTGNLSGQYFSNQPSQSFDISCTRTGPALF